MKPYDRPFLLRRSLDLSALFCLWCLYQWSSGICCIYHLEPRDALWRQEMMIRYDRGDFCMKFVRGNQDIFPGFIPRGFRCTHCDETPPLRLMRATSTWSTQWLVAFPVFPFFLLSATVLGVRTVRQVRADWPRLTAWHRARRRRREALRIWRGQRICRGCGYDLRATPHRCPECGLVPAGAEAPVTVQ